ncbi:uncharacterized protein A4U43_C07F35420 [Asparagus officinalis]|uniref:SET domain-containing protein n=1 Tax=Asparagus officinalis TaxID=4686 RepID=A0A5P1EL10_ASPOF|nr:tetratricopeptide repeat protein 12 [Asparagus officinalis]ONK65271.1 uncharacterized protein A4U43_C07F35420 [Asparagus officinalis]
MTSQLEEQLHHLRSKATELLFKEDWPQYINLYTHFISLCTQNPPNLYKPLPLAFSNRAEAHYKLKNLSSALEDCNQALEIDPSHLKSLICKGKILLDLNRYSQACDCFQRALSVNKSEEVVGLLDRCKKLDGQSRTGQINVSDWLVNGFDGKSPELAEFIGPVEIKRSDNGRRGLFATKGIEAGTVLTITKAVVLGRGILPESDNGSGNNARMVMWKDFVDRILNVTEKCSRTLYLLYLLSTGDESDEEAFRIPDMGLFKPEAEDDRFVLENKEPDVDRILKILDVNCLNEEAESSKVFGKKTNGSCSVGLWVLPSFVNHSCNPNVRRLHIGDYLVLHASRDIKTGEEITMGYFDILQPVNKRRELSKKWGFQCKCERCRFEEKVETEILGNGYESEDTVMRLEEEMKKKMMRKKERGYLRASYWGDYMNVYESEKSMRLGRRIPAIVVVAEGVAEAVGGDERVLRAAVGGSKRNGGGGGNKWVEIERLMKMGRGVYGRVVKKQGMRALFEWLNWRAEV